MKFHWLTLLGVALGGAVGAICRYVVAELAKTWFGESFPVGTLIVNIVGCFLLGLIAGASRDSLPQFAHPIIAIGFLGALTTFSTFGVETVKLFESSHWTLGLGNIAFQLGVGLFAAWVGMILARMIFKTSGNPA